MINHRDTEHTELMQNKPQSSLKATVSGRLMQQELTRTIIGAAIEVHRHLGPGLLESIYEQCLVMELNSCQLLVERQLKVPVFYKGKPLNADYRIDILVNKEVIKELKAVQTIDKIHEAQLLTYMKLAHKKIGLLMNFNVPVMKQGIRRFVL